MLKSMVTSCQNFILKKAFFSIVIKLPLLNVVTFSLFPMNSQIQDQVNNSTTKPWKLNRGVRYSLKQNTKMLNVMSNSYFTLPARPLTNVNTRCSMLSLIESRSLGSISRRPHARLSQISTHSRRSDNTQVANTPQVPL